MVNIGFHLTCIHNVDYLDNIPVFSFGQMTYVLLQE